MRAVGGTRPQVRRTIRWESVITALLGAVQGIVIGVLLGWAVSLALRDQGLSTFTPALGRARSSCWCWRSCSASWPPSSRPGGPPGSTCCGPSPSSEPVRPGRPGTAA